MLSYQEFMQAAVRERGPDHPVFKFNDKMSGRRLGEMSGVRVPDLLQGPTSLRRLVAPEGPAILKPVNGCTARGVFPLVPQRGGIFRELFTGGSLTWSDVVEGALAAKHSKRNEELLARGHYDALRPPWIVEELVERRGRGGRRELPYDWKAFCFGGRVEVIRQAIHFPEKPFSLKVKWYDRNWSPVGEVAPATRWKFSPRLPKPKHPSALVEAFEAVASRVDSPFVRVDLFEDEAGPVWGEVTPHPTGGHMQFVQEWDERLGRAWDAALA